MVFKSQLHPLVLNPSAISSEIHNFSSLKVKKNERKRLQTVLYHKNKTLSLNSPLHLGSHGEKPGTHPNFSTPDGWKRNRACTENHFRINKWNKMKSVRMSQPADPGADLRSELRIRDFSAWGTLWARGFRVRRVHGGIAGGGAGWAAGMREVMREERRGGGGGAPNAKLVESWSVLLLERRYEGTNLGGTNITTNEGVKNE